MVSIRRKANLLAQRAAAEAAEAEAADRMRVEAENVLTERMNQLLEIQDDMKKMKEDFNQEVLRSKKNFDERRKAAIEKRNELIRYWPDFWHDTIWCHPKLHLLLNEEDEEILKCMDCLFVEDFEDESGYTITFTFKRNVFFEETKLTKTFKVSGDGTMKATGTTINWKEGKGPLANESDDRVGNKRRWSKKSFFSWFGESSPETPLVKEDEIADMIRQDLWVNPLDC